MQGVSCKLVSSQENCEMMIDLERGLAGSEDQVGMRGAAVLAASTKMTPIDGTVIVPGYEGHRYQGALNEAPAQSRAVPRMVHVSTQTETLPLVPPSSDSSEVSTLKNKNVRLQADNDALRRRIHDLETEVAAQEEHLQYFNEVIQTQQDEHQST